MPEQAPPFKYETAPFLDLRFAVVLSKPSGGAILVGSPERAGLRLYQAFEWELTVGRLRPRRQKKAVSKVSVPEVLLRQGQQVCRSLTQGPVSDHLRLLALLSLDQRPSVSDVREALNLGWMSWVRVVRA